jgi:hypothetical protein
MSTTKILQLTQTTQIVDLNYYNTYVIRATGNFQIAVVTQEEMDAGNITMQSVSGNIQGKAQQPNSVLILTAETPIEVEITLTKEESFIQTPVKNTPSLWNSGTIFLILQWICSGLLIAALGYFLYRYFRGRKSSASQLSLLERLKTSKFE